MSDATKILSMINQNDPQAVENLLPMVYDELRKLAAAKLACEKPGQTIQATALVHEAYLRLVGGNGAEKWDNRGHFFSAAAEAMRRILVDQARHKRTVKAGGQARRVEMNDSRIEAPRRNIDVLALNEALDKLAALESRKAELVKLRYFAGLTLTEAAQTLNISDATADSDWAYAKSWLRVELGEEMNNDSRRV